MSSSGWVNFWKDQRQSFTEAMKVSTGFFAVRLETVFQLKPTDEIFDYGCGPGFLSDSLAPKNISVTGADINHFFIEQSKKNHAASLFIHMTTDAVENKMIFDEKLGKKKFDFIVLLSITQYFKDVDELNKVVGLLRSYMKENGRIIIADVVDQNTSSYRDAAALLYHCIKSGKAMVFFRFVSYLLFSNYRELSRQIKLLQISEETIAEVAEKNALMYAKVDGLTIHPTRANYVLTNSGTFSSLPSKAK